jgi:hypothetical protein
MKKSIIFLGIGGFLLSISLGAIALSGESNQQKVNYPKDYRNWTHVKSMVIQQGHPLFEAFGGIHHIYANEKALEAMTSGKSYPDGAILVFDLLEAKVENNAIVEGPRKVLGVMEKNTKSFTETGGWGFEAFKDDTQERVVKDPKGDCFSCHASQTKTDFVFSSYRK